MKLWNGEVSPSGRYVCAIAYGDRTSPSKWYSDLSHWDRGVSFNAAMARVNEYHSDAYYPSHEQVQTWEHRPEQDVPF